MTTTEILSVALFISCLAAFVFAFLWLAFRSASDHAHNIIADQEKEIESLRQKCDKLMDELSTCKDAEEWLGRMKDDAGNVVMTGLGELYIAYLPNDICKNCTRCDRNITVEWHSSPNWHSVKCEHLLNCSRVYVAAEEALANKGIDNDTEEEEET